MRRHAVALQPHCGGTDARTHRFNSLSDAAAGVHRLAIPTPFMVGRVNAYLIHSLSLGRENDLGLTSNYIKVSYARWNAAWNFLRNFSLGTDLFYEHDEESGGLIDETLNRYGGGFTLGYQFNFHLSAAFHYAYVQKDSDRNNRDYYQNRVGLDMNYRF